MNAAGEVWNGLVSGLPGAHILQTWQWGQVKKCYGWQPIMITWLANEPPVILSETQVNEINPGRMVAVAQVLQRAIRLPGLGLQMKVLYVPKGPLGDWANEKIRHCLLRDLAAIAHQLGAIFIKIDPDVPVGIGVPGSEEAFDDQVGQAVMVDMVDYGWKFSSEQIQFRNTVMIDLSTSEDALLASMKQKTRYNIRLAARSGVSVRPGSEDDLDLLYQMYAETAFRDGFIIRKPDYYFKVWSTFIKAGLAQPLIAEVEGEAVAGLLLFTFARRAWYLYGMSSYRQREKMPNYLLQWEAIRWARSVGCRIYDLWGAPDHFSEDDSLWGVYRFKEGLGGHVVRHIGAWDLPIRPNLYNLYTQVLPRLLHLIRRRGRKYTRQSVSV